MTSSRIKVILWIGLCLVVAGVVAYAVWRWRESEPRQPPPAMTQSNESDGDAVGDMNMFIPADQIEPLKQDAMRGDNGAANRLGNYYSQMRQPNEEARWRTVAANRGHCASMALLKESAEQAGDSRGAAHWNSMLRQNACTWGKAYPEVSDPNLDAMPLWNDQQG